MATIKVQNTDSAIVRGLIKALNAIHNDLISEPYDGYHRSLTSDGDIGFWTDPDATVLTVSAPDATNAATLYTLVNQIYGVMKLHFEDDAAHLVADTMNVDFVTTPFASTTATAVALVNQLVTDFTNHLNEASVHRKDDDGNAVTAVTATDESTAIDRANDLKDQLNSHMADGPSVGRIRTI